MKWQKHRPLNFYCFKCSNKQSCFVFDFLSFDVPSSLIHLRLYFTLFVIFPNFLPFSVVGIHASSIVVLMVVFGCKGDKLVLKFALKIANRTQSMKWLLRMFASSCQMRNMMLRCHFPSWREKKYGLFVCIRRTIRIHLDEDRVRPALWLSIIINEKRQWVATQWRNSFFV